MTLKSELVKCPKRTNRCSESASIRQRGSVPRIAVFGDPKGIPIQQTIYRDTPAPINCVFCGINGVTTVSLAAVVGCMIPMMLGICFMCPSMDCLWHKYHYCPSCKEQ
ncbi:GSH-induced LITAF domain protein-like [Tripterygium wilfordii]|uniref:GSH-induced LITAF domain protein-like n=1 Tax=Tripterygium wilfordii TaxID=458696 RepID=UPI0018F826A8|nr:GSH-induced LITAF domain protein-like [Tripterygium wilfordii]